MDDPLVRICLSVPLVYASSSQGTLPTYKYSTSCSSAHPLPAPSDTAEEPVEVERRLNCERSRKISPNPTGTKSSSRARRKSGRVLGNLLTTPKNRRRSPPGSPSSASGARPPGRRSGPARPPVWKSTSVSGARAVRRNEHHHAIEQASRRWRERAVKF